MRKKEISIKHIVEDRSNNIYVQTDILEQTITIGKGLKKRRFTLWEADRLEYLLKRQLDRLNGNYPKELDGEKDEFLICPHCGITERCTSNFCGNCGYDLSSAQKRRHGTA